MLARRTRLAVFVVYVVFHLTNSVLLKIGLFPRVTIAGTLTNSDMVLLFAHYLAAEWSQDRLVPDAEVRAIVMCSLNGREPALLIDPDRDLTQVERTWRHYDWILPLETPLAAAPAGRR